MLLYFIFILNIFVNLGQRWKWHIHILKRPSLINFGLNFNKITQVIKLNLSWPIENSVEYLKIKNKLIEDCKKGDLLTNEKYLKDKLMLLTWEWHDAFEKDKKYFKTVLEQTVENIKNINLAELSLEAEKAFRKLLTNNWIDYDEFKKSTDNDT